jgi:hypothetical protein
MEIDHSVSNYSEYEMQQLCCHCRSHEHEMHGTDGTEMRISVGSGCRLRLSRPAKFGKTLETPSAVVVVNLRTKYNALLLSSIDD